MVDIYSISNFFQKYRKSLIISLITVVLLGIGFLVYTKFFNTGGQTNSPSPDEITIQGFDQEAIDAATGEQKTLIYLDLAQAHASQGNSQASEDSMINAYNSLSEDSQPELILAIAEGLIELNEYNDEVRELFVAHRPQIGLDPEKVAYLRWAEIASALKEDELATSYYKEALSYYKTLEENEETRDIIQDLESKVSNDGGDR